MPGSSIFQMSEAIRPSPVSPSWKIASDRTTSGLTAPASSPGNGLTAFRSKVFRHAFQSIVPSGDKVAPARHPREEDVVEAPESGAERPEDAVERLCSSHGYEAHA